MTMNRDTSDMTSPSSPNPMYPSLRGKRALILGGSRGIGRAIALRLAREGCDVVVNYARSAEAAEATAADCRAMGVEATVEQADVGHEAELAALFERIAPDGLDILVNNAARGLERPRPAVGKRPERQWCFGCVDTRLGIRIARAFRCVGRSHFPERMAGRVSERERGRESPSGDKM